MRMEGADNNDIFTFDDIDTAFQNIVTVKYNQRITLQDRTTNIQGLYITNLRVHMIS